MLTQFERNLLNDINRILIIEYNDIPLSHDQLIKYLEKWKKLLDSFV